MGPKAIFTILGIVLALWLASGTVIVEPDEEGVMLVFGKVVRTVGPGLSWNVPVPFGQTFTPSVKNVRKIEVGFRTVRVVPSARYNAVPEEALMLTGDENIVSLEFIVQYQVKDAKAFLFHISNPVEALRDVSEAAMREVVGQSLIDQALTDGKAKIQQDAEKLIQEIMDQYDAGIRIVTLKLQDVKPPEQVNDAFKDVINAAQDKERKINDARGFANKVIPQARAKSAEMVNQAKGYEESRITEAEGVAQRFTSLLREYRKSKVVTKKRLYLESMEEIMPKMDKVYISKGARGGVLPYLNIKDLGKGGRK